MTSATITRILHTLEWLRAITMRSTKLTRSSIEQQTSSTFR